MHPTLLKKPVFVYKYLSDHLIKYTLRSELDRTQKLFKQI